MSRPSSKHPESPTMNDIEFRFLLEPTPTPRPGKTSQSGRFSRKNTKSYDFSNTSNGTPTGFSQTGQLFPKGFKEPGRKPSRPPTNQATHKPADAKALFKTHAIFLNKEEFQKIHKNDEPRVVSQKISSDLLRIKEKLKKILDLPDSSCIKTFRGLILEIFQGFNQLSVDIEAKVQVLIEKFEEKTEEINEKVKKYEKNLSVQEKEVIDSLIEKNLKLSTEVALGEKALKGFKVSFKQEKNLKLEENLRLLSEKTVVSLNKDLEEHRYLSTENSVEDLNEKTFKPQDLTSKNTKTVINILDYQLKRKDLQLHSALSDIHTLKTLITSMESRKPSVSSRSFSEISSKATPMSSSDLLSCLSCQAHWLESLIT